MREIIEILLEIAGLFALGFFLYMLLYSRF